MLNNLILGEGRPILLLHGATLDHRHMMESFEPIFAQRGGWQRIYVDLPGHGQSPARDSIRTQDDMLRSVVGFIAEKLPGRRLAVAGESRGSYIAQGLVHLHPDKISGVALIVPGGSPTADPARLPEYVVLARGDDLGDGVSEDERMWLESFHVVQTREIVERARRSKVPARPLHDAAQAARVNEAFDFSFHASGDKTRFDGPSLIVAGRQDCMSGYLDAIDLHAQFTRSTLAVLDAAGHGLAWERPAVFKALMNDWLDRVSAAY